MVVAIPKTVILLQPRPKVAIKVITNAVGSACPDKGPSTENNVTTDINHVLILWQKKKVIDGMGGRHPGLHSIEIPVLIGHGILKVTFLKFQYSFAMRTA
ncbi:MAG: hypothetical protein SGARI_002236 [Bacillariaceae sp.]